MRRIAIWLLVLTICASAARVAGSQRGPTPAIEPDDPDPRFDSSSAGEADPPPHRPRHAASRSSPPDARRGAGGAGPTTPEKRRATRRTSRVVAQTEVPDARELALSAAIDADLLAGRHGAAIVALRELEALHSARGDALAAAGDLGRIGQCYLADHCLAEAERAFEARLSLLRRALPGADHPELAHALNDLGFCLMRGGAPSQALPYFEAALAMRQRLHAGDHQDVALALSNVAFCLSALDRAEEALPRFEEALAMIERVWGEEGAEAALAQSNLASCLQALGRVEEALPRFEHAFAILERVRPGDDPDLARALGNEASCLLANGRASDALELHQRALDMRRRLYVGDHPELVASLTNLASTLDALGRSAEALPRFREALAIARRLYEGDHPEVAIGLNNVGACLQRLAREAEALFPLEAALAMWRRMEADDHPSLAASLDGLARCLSALGEDEEALPLLQDALAMRERLFPGDHPDVAASRAHLARCLLALGRAEDALPEFEAALAMRRRLAPGDSPQVAQSLNDFAACLDALGASEQALSIYASALAMWQRLYDEGTPDAASALVGAASCLDCLGRGTDALATYGEALSVVRRAGGGEAQRFASDLARLLVDDLGRPAEAVPVLDEAIGEIEHLRADERGSSAFASAGAARLLARGGAFDTMVRAQVALGNDAAALGYAERARVLGLFELLAGHAGDPLDELERAARGSGDTAALEALVALRRELDASAAELSRLVRARILAEGRAAAEQAERDLLLRLDVELAAARDCRRDALEKRARLLEQSLGWSAPLEPRELQALLEPGELVLYYSMSDELSFLFVVPPSGSAVRGHALVWPDGRPVRRDELDAAVDDYLRAMAMSAMLGASARGDELRPAHDAPVGAKRYAELGHELFRALVPASAWEAIRGARSVRAVPAGALQRLPLEALVVTPRRRLAESEFWLDVGPPIAYVPSASVLAWCRARRSQGSDAQRGALVAAGDPHLAPSDARAEEGAAIDGERPPPSWLAPASDARTELDQVSRAVPSSTRFVLLRGEDASASRLATEASSARFLHLALPGLSYDPAAGASALAVAREARGAGADGLLTASELFEGWGERLSGCEFVVLSATRVEATGAEDDDALFSLPAAFLRAGAPAAISGLWTPWEGAAGELWAQMYSRLLGASGAAPLEAFTAARRSFRADRPEPMDWAAFVAVGDPR